ncbi:hypothetical protein ABZ260_13055 [Streptosporangium sp. NPDC006013]|uniref:hypothetical protein n=1 Tax=Streptosporangium sp. NPDC006013 TaxID=3155596 RepID=UPI0033A3BEB7
MRLPILSVNASRSLAGATRSGISARGPSATASAGPPDSSPARLGTSGDRFEPEVVLRARAAGLTPAAG